MKKLILLISVVLLTISCENNKKSVDEELKEINNSYTYIKSNEDIRLQNSAGTYIISIIHKVELDGHKYYLVESRKNVLLVHAEDCPCKK